MVLFNFVVIFEVHNNLLGFFQKYSVLSRALGQLTKLALLVQNKVSEIVLLAVTRLADRRNVELVRFLRLGCVGSAGDVAGHVSADTRANIEKAS